jgi:glycerol-3-phosphate dehydrogenase (NAD(P)+)
MDISRIAVIGAGSWGTTLANILAENGAGVHLWVREPEVLEHIEATGINETFLPGVVLSKGIRARKSYENALDGAELVLMAVPSHVFREVLTGVKQFLRPRMAVLSATKGIENETLLTMAEVAAEVLPGEFVETFSCISGPSFAKEVSQKHPTAVTIACKNLEHAERLQRLLHREFLRVYVTQDLMGVQLGGALKNVIAIAAGAADALGFGHNARAALITRGLAEMTRLGVTMGANPLTFAGLAGIGDLVLTCAGDLSRNRSVGIKIGSGMTLQAITESMDMVAEGVKTTRSAYQLAQKMGVDMPITSEVYHILYQGKDPREAVRDLMTRTPKGELEH